MSSTTTDGSRYLVAGGTANVGAFVVAELLGRGAEVLVPSRSPERLDELRDHLAGRGVPVEGLRTAVGDPGDDGDGARLRDELLDADGRLDGAVVAVGDFVTTDRLLDTDPAALRRALDGYVMAHFRIARGWLPLLRERGGTWVMLQGPTAFGLTPREFGADLVSVATAAQHMLFRALARDEQDTGARVLELVSHAFIRDRVTQPGSPLTGQDVGRAVAQLLAGSDGAGSGQSIELSEPPP